MRAFVFLLISAHLVAPATVEKGHPAKASTSNYQYFCTGNCDTNVQGPTQPGKDLNLGIIRIAHLIASAGLVVMGGGTDVDAAFEWMIARAGGGDFLVLRTTGTDAYDPYIFDMGGLNSGGWDEEENGWDFLM